MAGGGVAGQNKAPSLLSFLVENTWGSSKNSGLGRQDLEVGLGKGFTGVWNTGGVEEDRGADLLGGVRGCGSTAGGVLNIMYKILLTIYLYLRGRKILV